jgi:hypothetical protein
VAVQIVYVEVEKHCEISQEEIGMFNWYKNWNGSSGKVCSYTLQSRQNEWQLLECRLDFHWWPFLEENYSMYCNIKASIVT